MASAGDIPNWRVARIGINMLLNDQVEEAKALFSGCSSNIHILSGVCYETALSALMAFDPNKINEASLLLKSIEEQYTDSSNWIKFIHSKLWISSEHDGDVEEYLYGKIVLADSLVCQALLKFLQDDFTSYVRGGWTFRKAWKLYQEVYEELTAVTKHNSTAYLPSEPYCVYLSSNFPTITTEINLPTGCQNDMNTDDFSHNNNSALSDNNTLNCHEPASNKDKKITDHDAVFEESKHMTRRANTFPDIHGLTISNNQHDFCEDAKNKSAQPKFVDVEKKSSNNKNKKNHDGGRNLRKSKSLLSSLSNLGSAFFETTSMLMGFRRPSKQAQSIDPATAARLKSAVCFGYGALRLCMSLVPDNAVRWVSVLGFQGDLRLALHCLETARRGEDMRAPFASLALLWYHTVARPYLGLDGKKVRAGVEEASKILEEESTQFPDSSLFLYFRGRIERLKSNNESAIKAFSESVVKAKQIEVKILGLHEVGWCHLLNLNLELAYECFSALRRSSRWSRYFYGFVATACAGATGKDDITLLRNDVIALLESCGKVKGAIEIYIFRRMFGFPWEPAVMASRRCWQLCIFEMLYLWNNLPSCSVDDLLIIVSICEKSEYETTVRDEPILGLGKLIYGVAMVTCLGFGSHKNLNESEEKVLKCCSYEKAERAFRECIELRAGETNMFGHVSAFAQFELANILLKNEQSRFEGKELMKSIPMQYKDYDFESKLLVRISLKLKQIEHWETHKDVGC